MTFDFTAMPPPEHWDHFVQIVRAYAPQMPEMESSTTDRVSGGASDVMTAVGAGASGAGGSVPGLATAGTVVSVGGALARGDVSAAVDAAFDDVMGRGADYFAPEPGGWLLAGLIMVLRGAAQSAERIDAMSTYLNSMSGYVATISRSSVLALRDPTSHATLPMPVVPAYVERTGDMYSGFARNNFTDGYYRVQNVILAIDAGSRPVGDYPSKQCFTHIGMQTNMTGESGSDFGRLRRLAERYILRSLLGVNMAQQAESLRRWATSH